eukprot:m.22648 g.22648  ORF g.22648 m.22648 type:complete len:129 (+) comp7421_c0_seq2:133-519(+)
MFNLARRMASTITRLHSGERSSQVVIHNGTVYLSGQVASDPTVGVQDQTRDCLKKIEGLLAEANSDKHNLLSATIYLRDMKDFAAMNEVWNAWVKDVPKPVRACVNAELARRELLVEVCMIAAEKPKL